MKKTILNKVICEITCIASLMFAINASADNAANQQSLDMASGWILQQQNMNGSWGSDQYIRFSTTAAVVDALDASNQYNSNYYAGLAWLENHNASNVDYLSHRIQVLESHGNNTQVDLDDLHNASQITQDGWGLSSNYTSTALDTAIALGALIKSGDITGQAGAIDYLLASQNIDGGWSLQNTDVSDYWVTAHTLAALVLLPSPAVDTAISNAVTFLSTITASASDLAISQTILALHRNQGLTPNVDTLIAELLSRQTVTGDWGDVYTTSTSMRALSAALGTDLDSYNSRAGVTDQTLRSIINGQLGKNAYDNLVQGEILLISSLDLRATNVANLNGLDNAYNLTEIRVNAGTDISAVIGLTGLAIIVDGVIDVDFDGIADANDNCPNIPNGLQENLDGDAYGDYCDDDIDGDGFTVAQGDLDDYDPSIYPIIVIAGDVNGDDVVNVADILLIQRHVLGTIVLDASSVDRADLYPASGGDGILTLQDILLMQSLVLGN